MSLSAIYNSIQEDLGKVEDKLKSVRKVQYLWLSELLAHSLKGGGKRIRPALTLLSGKFYHYNLDSLVMMAVAIEVMHTATLVHDDAIDKSPVRRGRPTINQMWGEDKAMLLGDYLFAKAGELAANTRNLRVIKLASQTLMTISSGEINQAFNAFNLEQTRDDYLQRIAGKTASLFSLSTESGAILSQAPEKSVEVLKKYGFNLGIAFQVVDDILDFIGVEEKMGKPIGSDLAQGTLTLPSMLLLEHYPRDNPVVKLFRSRDKQENIKRAIEMVRDSSIVDQCFEFASDYCSRACHNLNHLSHNTNCQPLIELAEYVVSRQR